MENGDKNRDVSGAMLNFVKKALERLLQKMSCFSRMGRSTNSIT